MSTPRLIATPKGVEAGEAARLHRALIDLCYDRGFAALTIGDLCGRAGCKRADFDRHYADLHDCLIQVFRAELDRYRHRATAGDWRSRLRATTYAIYRFMGEHERLCRLLLDERCGDERTTRLIGDEIDELSRLIDEGRDEPTAPSSVTDATAEALGGAIFLELCLAAGREDPRPPEAELIPRLMYSAVLPYAGVASAGEELLIPPPSR